MEQVIFGGYYDQMTTVQPEYTSFVGGGNGWNATMHRLCQLCSTDGVLKELRVKLSNAPGAGNHWDFTLYVGDNPTALTLEIADTDTEGSNMVNEIDITPGDCMVLWADDTGGSTIGWATWTIVFEGDTANESLILGTSGDLLNNAAIRYAQIECGRAIMQADEDDCRQVIPTDGTIKNFYVELSEDAGTDPDAYRFTVRLNGATHGNSPIVTIIAPATTGNDLVNELDVVAGDVMTMMVEPVDTPSATPRINWGLTFVADIDGESIALGGTMDTLDDASTEYNYLTCCEIAGFAGWTGTENQRYQLGQIATVKKLHMLLDAAPGVGNTYTFTIRIATAGSNVVAVVTGAATTGDSGGLEDDVANDEYVDLQVVPDDDPDEVAAYWGYVIYREPEEPTPPDEEGGLRLNLSLRGHGGFDLKTMGGYARRKIN